MYECITLKQLTEMFSSLPEEVLSKRIGYLDLAHMTIEDLEELKERMLSSENSYIEFCSN